MKPSKKLSRPEAPQRNKEKLLAQTLTVIADFFHQYKVGYQGSEGYRKSTDLEKFVQCAQALSTDGYIHRDRTRFADLGCADGRVNVLMSYFVKCSIGIEIDRDILKEYGPRNSELADQLKQARLLLPADNVSLFKGSSLERATFDDIFKKTGIAFTDIDLFYTYITLHDAFAEKIAQEARDGALYLVYGFHKILPRYQGLDLLEPDVGGQGIAALYVKGQIA